MEYKKMENHETTTNRTKAYSPWDPTQEEIDTWDKKVLEILRQIEIEHSKTSEQTMIPLDRTGKQLETYQQSLPPFLLAASNGDLSKIQDMVKQAQTDDNNNASLRSLLLSQDRHLSTASHWAAGGGHLECLMAILELEEKYIIQTSKTSGTDNTKIRRRDGKTCLHYAARNGHLNCVEYILTKTSNHCVDEVSGDGTTPLHMACYGSHLKVVEYLIKKGADVMATNSWGCTAAHWVGMTISKSKDDIRRLCRFLNENGVSFSKAQSQGHTALHKAAQRQNKYVIEWMADPIEVGGAGLCAEEIKAAGCPDIGGHKPSQILRSFGGDDETVEWMSSLGW